MPRDVLDEVRAHCMAVAREARWISIDPAAADYAVESASLDPDVHFLDGTSDAVARFVLVMDAVNFGSGWFAELGTGYDAITGALAAHARGRGEPWRAAELRTLRADTVARVVGLPPAHELAGHYARALRDLGAWLGDRPALEAIQGLAATLAGALAAGMPFYADRGFYKRAQITVNDLALAGVAAFPDLDRLTVFADDLVPHVLRMDGVLTYAPELAERIDAGRELLAGSAMEIEVRACAVHACELVCARLGVAPRILDTWLWNRGQAPPYDRGPRHRTRSVYY